MKGAAEYTSYSLSAIEEAVRLKLIKSRAIRITGKRITRRIKREWLDSWIDGPTPEPPITANCPRCASFVPAFLPRYLNMRDAASYCGLSLRTVQTAVASGEVVSFMRGRRLVLRESLEAWVEGKVQAITHPST